MNTVVLRYSVLQRFRRVTSSGRFIPQIDGLRFVAILTVYLYHLNGFLLERGEPTPGDPSRHWVTRTLEHGHYGVQLFFVISGFVLALPFASHYLCGSKPVSLRAYFLRRLTRLEPPYVLSMLLFFSLLVLQLGHSARELVPHLTASLLYLHNIAYGAGSPINAVAWSLEVEIQFYVLVPLLAGLFTVSNPRLRRAGIAALICVAVIFQAIFVSPDRFRLDRSILGQLQFFLVGFLLADVYLTEWRSNPESAFSLGLGGARGLAAPPFAMVVSARFAMALSTGGIRAILLGVSRQADTAVVCESVGYSHRWNVLHDLSAPLPADLICRKSHHPPWLDGDVRSGLRSSIRSYHIRRAWGQRGVFLARGKTVYAPRLAFAACRTSAVHDSCDTRTDAMIGKARGLVTINELDTTAPLAPGNQHAIVQ